MTNNFYQEYYQNIGSRDWQWRELGGSVKAQNIVSVTNGLKINTILEIGCGTGAVLAALAKTRLGEQFFAIDVAEPPIQLLKQRTDLPQLVEATVFDGNSIPYPTQQFDLAVLSHVIEHVVDPSTLIREAVRVARYVAIEVPLEENFYTRLQVGLLGSKYREEIGHIQWFNRRKLHDLLESRLGLHICAERLVMLPEEVYQFRKQSLSPKIVKMQVRLRRVLCQISPALYMRLLPDHYIILVSGS